MNYQHPSWLVLSCLAVVHLAAGACGCDAGTPKTAPPAPAQQAAQPSSAQPADQVPAPTAPRTAAANEDNGSAAVSPDEGARPAAQGPCAKMCEHAVNLRCGPRDACLTSCAEMLKIDLCPEPMATFLACATQRPESDWECTPEGVAAVKDGVCDKEQLAFVMCVERAGGGR